MSKKDVRRSLVSSRQVDRTPVGQGRTALAQSLSDTQRRTIEILRGDVLRCRNKRIEYLKAYEKDLKRKEPKPIAPKPKAPSCFSKALAIRASIPLTAADVAPVMAFLEANVDGDKTAFLQFPDALNHRARILGAGSEGDAVHEIGSVIVDTQPLVRADRFPSFGLDLSVSKHGLQAIFRYRTAPGSLRLPDEKRAQGGLSLRFALARQKASKPASQQIKGENVTNSSTQTDLNQAIDIGVEGLLSGDRTANLLGYETLPLDDVAWQDFSEYLHALPLSIMRVLVQPDPSPEVVGTLITLEQEGVDSGELSQFLTVLDSALWTRIVTDVTAFIVFDPDVAWQGLPEFPEQVRPELQDYIVSITQQCYSVVVNTLQSAPDVIATLAEIYWALPLEHRQTYVNWVAGTFRSADQEPGDFYFWNLATGKAPSRFQTRWPELAALTQSIWGWALKALLDPEEKQELPEVVPPYDFVWFTPPTWNLGLRLIYRQEWRALGNQRGEIVRTIPLGPRQTEKVSTRITRRTKVVRTSEDLKSIETTTEMATSAKDSSETIDETIKTKKWHVEADASANFGFASASVSGGSESGEEDRDRKTTTTLTESSQKNGEQNSPGNKGYGEHRVRINV